MRILFLDPQKKALLSPSVWSRSIVDIGVSPPHTPLKNRHLLFLDKHLLNLQTVQVPLFRQSLLFIGFL